MDMGATQDAYIKTIVRNILTTLTVLIDNVFAFYLY